jgi:hypoxia up-regulated 1
VTTEEQREEITKALKEAEDWLFDQEDDGFEKFKTKHKTLKELSEPVYIRIKEVIERPKAIAQTEELFNYTRTMVKDFEKDRPWIPEEDRNKVTSMVEEVEGWLKNKTIEQEAKKPHEMPAYLSHDLLRQLRPVAKFSNELLRRPKPKPKKTKKAKGKKNATDTNSTDTEGDSKTEDYKKEGSGEGAGEEKKDGEKDDKKEETKDDDKKEL